MKTSPVEEQRQKVWWWIVGIYTVLFIIAYSNEMFAIWEVIASRTTTTPLPLNKLIHAIGIFIYEPIILAVVFFGSLAVVSQFVLPVQTRQERRRVFGRLLLHIRGKHGPAVFVKDGKLVGSHQELENKRKGPGVALIDSASAIALEKENSPQKDVEEPKLLPQRDSLSAALYKIEKREWKKGSHFIAPLLSWWRWLGAIPSRKVRQLLLRLHLTRPRRPPRAPRAARVEGPGIVFTNADENIISTLDLRKQSRSRPNIKGLTRDGIVVTTNVNVTFTLDDPPSASRNEATNNERNQPAFNFNPQSAFRAVYGTPVSKKKADDEDDETVQDWTDLPVFVACDIFRDMISTQTLDHLFHPTSDNDFPLNELRKEFNKEVQSQPVLKERGIKVISASFSALGLPDAVKNQRFKNWQAEWQRRAVETLAAGDLETNRIIQRARANAEYDMVKRIIEMGVFQMS